MVTIEGEQDASKAHPDSGIAGTPGERLSGGVSNRTKATLVTLAHGVFTISLFGGFILQIWYPALTLPLLIAAAGTLVAEVVYRGCPLTILENHYRPGTAYGRYEGSFIRHYVRRFTGLVVPRGLVPAMITAGLLLSAVTVVS